MYSAEKPNLSYLVSTHGAVFGGRLQNILRTLKMSHVFSIVKMTQNIKQIQGKKGVAKKRRILKSWNGPSPDLNPIENLWWELKPQFAKQQPNLKKSVKWSQPKSVLRCVVVAKLVASYKKHYYCACQPGFLHQVQSYVLLEDQILTSLSEMHINLKVYEMCFFPWIFG